MNTTKKQGPLQPLVYVIPNNIFKALSSQQMLQIIFFAIFFGIVLVTIPSEKIDPVFKLIDGLNEIFVRMVIVVMQFMPIFVFALMAGQVVTAAGSDPDKFFSLLDFLLKYSAVVILGLVIIWLVHPHMPRQADPNHRVEIIGSRFSPVRDADVVTAPSDPIARSDDPMPDVSQGPVSIH